MSSFIVAAIVLALVAVAVISMIRSKKKNKGCYGCSANCGCKHSTSSNCH